MFNSFLDFQLIAHHSNDIGKAYKYLPFPFKDFNDANGLRIQSELLYGPDPKDYPKELCKDDIKSVLIYHFTNDTHGLIEFFDKNGVLFFGSGHLKMHDLIMLIEIFYHHAF